MRIAMPIWRCCAVSVSMHERRAGALYVGRFGRALDAKGRPDLRKTGCGRPCSCHPRLSSIWILRQPEPKMFSRSRIKYFVGAGPGTFDFRYVMHAKARTLVKRTRVPERVLAARFVDVKANHLVADWAFGDNWVKALTSRHLGKFANPNVKLSHGHSQSFANAGFDLDQVTARRQNSRSSLTPVHYSGLMLVTKRLQIVSRADRGENNCQNPPHAGHPAS